MSKIEEMIREMCPEGVKMVKLGELCKSLKKATLTQGELKEDGEYPVINSGRTLYGYYSAYNNEGNAFIIAARGEYAGFVNYMSNKFWAGGLCYPYRSKDECILMTKFVYYYLKSFENTMRETLVSRGSIPAINKGDIDQVEIPLPPLPIQEKIVEILEKFSLLSAELEAELEGRRKQYDFYRNRLLSFDSGSDSVQWKTLGEVCQNCYAGATPSTSIKAYWENGTIPWMSSGEVNLGQVYDVEKRISQLGFDNCSTKMVPANSVVIALAGQGKTRGTVAITRIELCTNQSLCALIPNTDILSAEYLYMYLKTQYTKLRDVSAGDGTRGGLNLKMIKAYPIPIPSLEKQKEIVALLARFDKLVTDLSVGLPAEIERVQKQYEYYRNKLLTFPEA